MTGKSVKFVKIVPLEKNHLYGEQEKIDPGGANILVGIIDLY